MFTGSLQREVAAPDAGRETPPYLAAEDLGRAVAIRSVADGYAPAVGGDFHAVVAVAAPEFGHFVSAWGYSAGRDTAKS